MHQWLPVNTIIAAMLGPFSEIPSPLEEETFQQTAGGVGKKSGEKHLLIVDDDPMILMLVSKMVSKLGYRPKTAADGMEALFHLSRSTFTLIIIDHDMPLMNGLELAGQIKKTRVNTPVLIMIGNHDMNLMRDIERSGLVAGVLLRPFNLATLREKIETVTRHGPIRWVS